MIVNSKENKNELENIAKEPFIQWDKLAGKSILVTGASGMIGSYLVDLITTHNSQCSDGISVYALSRSQSKLEERFGESNTEINMIAQDICEPLAEEISFDYIIHAASNTHPLEYAKKL